MCSIASSTESTTADGEHRARGTRCPSPRRSRRPASRRRRPAQRLRARRRRAARHRPRAGPTGRAAGTAAATSRARAASPPRCTRRGAATLALSDDRLGHVEVGVRVHVDVAVARRRVDHRHRRDRLERRLQPLAAARDDQVDEPVLRGQLRAAPRGRRRPPVRSRPSGSPASAAAAVAIAASTRVGVRGDRRAAQHDRVARLQAQRGAVDRHVRARLVDDRDDAERHAHLAHVEAVGQPEALDHLADRVRQRRRSSARRPAIPATRASSSAQPVEQRRVEAAGSPASMSRSLASSTSAGARLERGGDRLQRARSWCRCRGAASVRDGALGRRGRPR